MGVGQKFFISVFCVSRYSFKQKYYVILLSHQPTHGFDEICPHLFYRHEDDNSIDICVKYKKNKKENTANMTEDKVALDLI